MDFLCDKNVFQVFFWYYTSTLAQLVITVVTHSASSDFWLFIFIFTSHYLISSRWYPASPDEFWKKVTWVWYTSCQYGSLFDIYTYCVCILCMLLLLSPNHYQHQDNLDEGERGDLDIQSWFSISSEVSSFVICI